MSNGLTISGATKSTSIYDLPPEMDGALRDAFIDLSRGSKREGHLFCLERLPTADERKLLIDRYRALDPTVKPIDLADASLQHAGAAIADMFKSWPAFKPESKEQSIGHYVMVMKDLPLFAIREACLCIERGEIEKLSQYAPPPAPFVYQLAKEKSQRIVAQHKMLREILSTKTVRVEYQVTEEQQDRMAKGLAARSAEIRAEEERILTELREKLAAESIESDRRRILDEYRHYGVNPVYALGRPVSPSLIRSNREYLERDAMPKDEYQDLGS